ncbi:MAG TPA: AMP-binding protein, partial [Burkholderiales bacterium]|nr:AMP-binding protein [Burkholderiales bacterium]
MLNVHDRCSLPLRNAHAGEWADHCRTIGEAIAWQARVRGGSPALVDAESDGVTFAQLHTCIASFAGHLARAGLTREDRVGLFVPTGAQGAQLLVALAANTTLVPLNPALTPAEIIEVAKRAEVKAIVIPAWLDTPARPAILAHGIAVLEAVAVADGGLSLESLGPEHSPVAPVR